LNSRPLDPWFLAQYRRKAYWAGGQHSEFEDDANEKILLSVALLCMIGATPVKAEVIDVSTVKCADLATMKEDEISYLLIWLHGYYGGKAGDTTIDLASLESSGGAIGEKCGANPELGLMTAIQQMTQ
jgi:acid stress chaperone HdeB